MRILVLAVLLLGPQPFGSGALAEIIDRVAVTVDQDVITGSEIRGDIRVTAFLNGTEPDFSPENRRKTAERLVEQILMRREMRLTNYPEVTPDDILDRVTELIRHYGSEGPYRAALRRYGIGELQLRDTLMRQEAVLRFIDLRFKPEVQVLEPELLEFYNRVCLPEYRRKNPGRPDPSFDDLRSDCEELMVSQRVDTRIEAWLKEATARARIRYVEDAFQ